ncbi:MAG: hypothetical protein J6Q60_05600 [Bacteroidaceae bacterium]|nr:hypothetical protein [Bacteroidaceae bacterium]
MSIKCYSELITIPTFIERYRYLKIGGRVGGDTFGHDRYLNQILYHSGEWIDFRDEIIIRDNGCDLAHPEFELRDRILIHHINPITVEDVLRRDPKIFDPENVISTCLNTHNAIHYGDESRLMLLPITRTRNDTCPWRN